MAKSIKKDFKKSIIPKTGSTLVNNLSLLTAPTKDLSQPIAIADFQSGLTLNDLKTAQEAARIEKRRKYDYALNTPLSQLTAEGIYVDVVITDSSNGSLFQGTPDYAKVWLAIQDIQEIENERGNPGALLLHMQQPAIAKDTAGYPPGGSGTFSGTEPTFEPIPDVAVLPPVTKTPDGTVDFDPNAPGAYDVDPNNPTGIISEQGMMGGKYYWLWYVAAAVIIILFLKFGRK